MIRALALDAVGTLIHPDPPAWQVYADVGKRHGSGLSVAELRSRFRTAFRRQESLDQEMGLRTSEMRELERWRAIVAEVMNDLLQPEACFRALYEHFGEPKAWRVSAEAVIVLPELRRRGYRLAMASNYDERLRVVWAGLPTLHDIEHLVISSEVGWRKPAPGFFAALCRQLTLPAHEILLVGDDRANDFEGARQAGLQAILFDPENEASDLGAGRIGKLEELLQPGRLKP
jgi:putative hydrolase of the HAD superfamily